MKITIAAAERETGAFERKPDTFRNWVRRDASTANFQFARNFQTQKRGIDESSDIR